MASLVLLLKALMKRHSDDCLQGECSIDTARHRAYGNAKRQRNLVYGKHTRDYLWSVDENPQMWGIADCLIWP